MINLDFLTSTGIYISARNVYIVQLKRTLFSLRLVKFGKIEIQTPAQTAESAKERDQAIIKAIKRVVQENKISLKKVIAALSVKDILIRYFQMPKLPKADWKTAIKFEAKKYIPFKIEELIWDFQVVLPRDKEVKMNVVFVAIKKEITPKYLSLLKEADLKPLVLEPVPFSLIRFFALGKQLAEKKPTAIVNVEYGVADINIVKDKISYLARDVSLPLEEEAVFDSLLNEIHMSLDYYERLFPLESIGKILLCGEMPLKDWDKRLAEELKVSVEKADFAKALKIRKVLPPLNMAVAIGAALRGLTRVTVGVNLRQEVPKAVPKPKVPLIKTEAFKFTPEIRRAVFRAGIISGIGLLLLYLVMFQRIVREKKQLEQTISLRPKLSLSIDDFSYANLEQMKKELNNKFSILNLLIDKRIFWTTKFNELSEVIPPGVWLTNLSFTDKLAKGNKVIQSLTIKGVAYAEDPVQEIRIVTKFISKLKENEGFTQGFKEIKLDSMVSGELEGRPMKNFAISCTGQ